MKKIIFALLFSVLCSNLFATAALPKGWLNDYDAALQQAKKENKYVYVLFVGSDWCGWCKKLQHDILDKNEFKKFAKEKMLLVYCDFPRSSKVSEAQKIRQLNWMRQLGGDGGVPLAVIVDSDGKVAGRIGGYLPLKDYINKLKSIVK